MGEDYSGWLYMQTGAPSTQRASKSYWSLFNQMHTKPFRWFVPNDDNRNEDGKELREEFLAEYEIHEPEQWLEMDASMLEMLIALSRRAAFESYGTSGDWFWQILTNLGLKKYSDAVYNQRLAEDVNDVLEQVITRDYNRDGRGGMFPLRQARYDQRQTEIWYQLSAYLMEGLDVANGP